MQQLWLIPSLPLMGFLLLVLGHGRCSRSLARLVGVGSVAMAALVTIWVTLDFYSLGATQTYQVELWPWFRAGVFEVSFGLYLDGLALSMLLVITGVGSLIHWYASGYMWQDPDYQRFFAYMNLFVAAMLVLVLADNLCLLYTSDAADE